MENDELYSGKAALSPIQIGRLQKEGMFLSILMDEGLEMWEGFERAQEILYKLEEETNNEL